MRTYVSKYKPVTGSDERLYRAEWREQRTCTEIGIRGPFNGSVFKPNGQPKYMVGYRTAFKVQRGKAMATDSRKSKKHDSEMDLDWRHFAHELGFEVVE